MNEKISKRKLLVFVTLILTVMITACGKSGASTDIHFTMSDFAFSPGEFTIRAEYIRQFGDGHPDYAVGVQQDFDLMPPVNVGTLVAAYSVTF